MSVKRGVVESGKKIKVTPLSGVGLFLWHSSQKRVTAIIAREDEWRDGCAEVLKTLSELKASSPESLESVTLKWICPDSLKSSLVTRLESEFKKLGFDSLGVALRGKGYSGSTVEVVLDSETGAVKIAEKVKTAGEEKKQGKIRVLIVDDSPTLQKLLQKVIATLPGIEVVAATTDPREVTRLIEEHKPDVMTLDINMPIMNGDELLRQIFPKYYVPTIILSSLNIDESSPVLKALELGAVDYLSKPSANELAGFAPIFKERLLIASRQKRFQSSVQKTSTTVKGSLDQSSLLALGASTGGTEAIKSVLTAFPAEVPPILIVQHIPPYFSKAFADRLNELCLFTVKEAENGEPILSNHAYVAPGGHQMGVKKEGTRLVIEITDSPPMTSHRPSVDFLFESLCKLKGQRIVAALMTGMGRDGARGLKSLKEKGHYTFAQDEKSCVVYGMPKAAIELNAHCEISSLSEMALNLSLRLDPLHKVAN